MNEQLLRDRMEQLVQHAPTPTSGVEDDVRRGRRSLRLRRGLAATMTAGAVGVSVAVVGAGWLNIGGTATVDAADSALSEGTILQRCQDIGAPVFDAHWSGGARLLTFATSAGNARAVLVSPDGKRWADCGLRDSDPGWVATYPVNSPQDTPSGREHSNGETGPGPGEFSLMERFPNNVTEVSLKFDDGTAHVATAVEGFVVFQLSGLEPSADLDSVFLYDQAGTLLAGPDMGQGDASLPARYRTLVPQVPLDIAGDSDRH